MATRKCKQNYDNDPVISSPIYHWRLKTSAATWCSWRAVVLIQLQLILGLYEHVHLATQGQVLPLWRHLWIGNGNQVIKWHSVCSIFSKCWRFPIWIYLKVNSTLKVVDIWLKAYPCGAICEKVIRLPGYIQCVQCTVNVAGILYE